MTAIDHLPVTRRVAEIEGALAKALASGDFEIVTRDGERYLRPILAAHVTSPEAICSYPLLSLDRVAREMERILS